ncbi:hypothetical protein B0T26DRAFT_756800 [Lasiosphaeria miniovina]|uniref:Uncharacterized protein n=1 Tax=Lasiosphaeria miniovina TaxID=1954250 RepID=A0AA39ZTC0_9PEZI|nr:uncharacterized protein B0T26DRAFT_756800 [Lasiosphaeria miniovina]KAK0703241.1 hypothetical protein B0T26DRAFT_756800 [Lasiosphaeria miniovina]
MATATKATLATIATIATVTRATHYRHYHPGYARMTRVPAFSYIEDTLNVYDKYLERPVEMEHVAYVEFLKNWNFKARNSESLKVEYVAVSYSI